MTGMRSLPIYLNLRKFDPKNYDSEKGDILDERILDTIKQSYPGSKLSSNVNILFQNQLEESLKQIDCETKRALTIQFFPMLPFENIQQFAGKEFYAYPFPFSLRILMIPDKNKMEFIHDFLTCYLPYNEIERLVKTIQIT
jgi:hypothetical protein